MKHLPGRLTEQNIVDRSETRSQRAAKHGLQVLVGVVIGIGLFLYFLDWYLRK